MQNGARYTAVRGGGLTLEARDLELKPFNFPQTGDTGQVFGIQLGGFFLTIEPDGQGVQRIKNFKHLLLGPEATTIDCNAGKIVFAPGCMKMNKPNAVWALTQGPSKFSTVPMHEKTADLKAGRKQMSTATREAILTLPRVPECEVVHGYYGYHQGNKMVKLDADCLFELGADGKELYKVDFWQENLLKLLKFPGMQLHLTLSKKIPNKPKGVALNIFAQHPDVNMGQAILLFANASVAGPPPHILQNGLLPGGKSLRDVMDLPWITELRKVMEELVKPLVDFACYFDNCVRAKKYQVNTSKSIPKRMLNLVQHLSKLYNSQDKEEVEILLSYVTTNVANSEGDEWRSSGLVVDTKVKKLVIKKGKGKEEDSEEEEEDDEEDEDGGGWW